MNKLKIHTFETKLLNNFKVLKKFTIILSCVIVSMVVKKCECSPDSPSYLNDDDMIICNSCGGWIEGQY